MNFFTTDTHFGDDEVLKQDLRPFKNAKQFAKTLIWHTLDFLAKMIFFILLIKRKSIGIKTNI